MLAKAWDRFDTEQRNALSRALFGRGGLEIGRILSQLKRPAGSTGSRRAGQNIILTQQQAERFDKLKDTIDATRQRAKDLMASLFTEEMLNRELKHVAAHGTCRARRRAMAENPSWWNRFVIGCRPNAATSAIRGHALGPRRTPADRCRKRTRPSRRSTMRPTDRVEQPTLRAQLNTLRERNALLGEAITPSEQLKQKTLELAVGDRKRRNLARCRQARA